MQTFISNYKDIEGIVDNKNRILLVCDSFFCKSNQYEMLNAIIKEKNIEMFIFTEFEPNPKYESVVKGIETFNDNRCNFIIAVGGGSAIDVAKCIKVYNTLDTNKILFEQKVVDSHTKLLAIPSTSGTGSESTKFAVIYYLGEKRSVNYSFVLPEYVYLDPTLVYSVPVYQKNVQLWMH